MSFPRSSGILLHPTSLPGAFGIGDLGPESYKFADFLEAAGQSVWQVLPLGPTGYGDSPYACYSAFAGNTLLVSPEQLVSDGLLTKQDLANIHLAAADMRLLTDKFPERRAALKGKTPAHDLYERHPQSVSNQPSPRR